MIHLEFQDGLFVGMSLSALITLVRSLIEGALDRRWVRKHDAVREQEASQ